MQSWIYFCIKPQKISEEMLWRPFSGAGVMLSSHWHHPVPILGVQLGMGTGHGGEAQCWLSCLQLGNFPAHWPFMGTVSTQLDSSWQINPPKSPLQRENPNHHPACPHSTLCLAVTAFPFPELEINWIYLCSNTSLFHNRNHSRVWPGGSGAPCNPGVNQSNFLQNKILSHCCKRALGKSGFCG